MNYASSLLGGKLRYEMADPLLIEETERLLFWDFEDATSTAARRLDCSDVDLFHLHHRIERTLFPDGKSPGA